MPRLVVAPSFLIILIFVYGFIAYTGFLSLTDMLAATQPIVDAVDLPVMADGDTGFGNAVNAWYTVQAFERMKGVPKRIKYDNQKAVVIRREGGQLVVQFLDLRLPLCTQDVDLTVLDGVLVRREMKGAEHHDLLTRTLLCDGGSLPRA